MILNEVMIIEIVPTSLETTTKTHELYVTNAAL